ncbi:lantibiotic immunity ABC transporter MutE/EpiE family permease subunit [Geobacillus proteiniphilus]|uniref:Lantibiotic immunity ABC transporter MutE/EpiE family permease subunit n=1 Tax=Geobacillus proteiniphilus TaxID=860353 RepID=A0ABY9MD16_9BACL|nr:MULTISPECIES: lantibiotic immunity ABC transporter MutE/EpiE family permease subunit [Geobacillus]WMJ15927.1 lantibiotic immunity ABC transporter MutE/EpiE family permease subunit [Geobacillus proteiniphilus]
MLNMFQSEHLKYKRTFAKKLVFIAPLFFVLYAMITMPTMNSTRHYFEYTVFNWWPLIFVPIGTALTASLSVSREKKSGNDKALRCLDISIVRLWWSKIAVIAYYMLLSTIELIVLLVLLKWFLPNSLSSATVAVFASLVIWMSSLAYIPIGLFIAERFGMAASILVSVIGLALGVVMAAQPYWLFIPWSWGMRMMCPIVGVHPNGVPLEKGNPLLDPSVIPIGLTIALVMFLLLSFLTAVWFSRKEVH